MGKRQLFQYEYTCDGYTHQGKKCDSRTIINAPTSNDADFEVTTKAFGPKWSQDIRGWMCDRYDEHRGVVGNPNG